MSKFEILISDADRVWQPSTFGVKFKNSKLAKLINSELALSLRHSSCTMFHSQYWNVDTGLF